MSMMTIAACSRRAVMTTTTRAITAAAPVFPRFFSGDAAEKPELSEEEKKAVALEQARQDKIVLDRHMMYSEMNVVPFQARDEFGPMSDHTIPTNPTELLALDPLPRKEIGRSCMIRKPGKHHMSNDMSITRRWELVLDENGPGDWINPLMGWVSSCDPQSTNDYYFDSKEEAIAFATKKGYNFTVKEPDPPANYRGGQNTYSQVFLPQRVVNKLASGGARRGTKIFANAKSNGSAYFKPLKFHGDGLVKQHGGDSKVFDKELKKYKGNKSVTAQGAGQPMKV